MNPELDFYWSDLGENIARGYTRLSVSDMISIMEMFNFGSMRPECLPGKELACRNTKNQKANAIKLVHVYWGISENDLMEMEQGWLKDIREKTGKSLNDSKDDASELITPQILARIVSTAYFFYLCQSGKVLTSDIESNRLVCEALLGLNLFIENACLKGRSRSYKYETTGGEQEVAYNIMVESGVPVGAFGLFLPDPVVSLPQIFALLHRDSLRSTIYLNS